jgi:hypothetical protein
MKSPEQYLEDAIEKTDDVDQPFFDKNHLIYDGKAKPIINAIKQAQIDAYNESLDDTIKHVAVEHIDLTTDEVFDYTDVLVDDDVEVRVNKQSILNLKK